MSPSELVANGLGDVVSSAVGSVFGALISEATPFAIALAPLAATLGDSATAVTGSAGLLFPCGALAGVDGSDFAGVGGFGLALKLDRHCINRRPRMAASTTSRSSLRKPLPLGSSSNRYSTPSVFPLWEFKPRKEGPRIRPPFPHARRV